MRWIQHDKSKGKIARGEADPPEGTYLFFVDENGSAALVNGRLYVDGRPAPPGRHNIRLRDAVLPVDVDAKGRAQRRPVMRGVPNA